MAFCGDNAIGPLAGSPGYVTVFNRSGSGALAESISTVREYDPDIVLGGHSGACLDPFKGLEELETWARNMTKALLAVVEQPSSEAVFDPYWTRFYPYCAQVKPGATIPVSVKVVNYHDTPKTVQLKVLAPDGFAAKMQKSEKTIQPGATYSFNGTLKIDKDAPGGLQLLAADLTFDGKRLGEAAVMVLDLDRELGVDIPELGKRQVWSAIGRSAGK